MVYSIWVYLFHPKLGYMLDSDAVAYLTIAERAAHGQFEQSINGLWSPLNSWLMIPFLQQGYQAWTVAKLLNVCFGGILLVQSFLLYRTFIQHKLMLWVMMLSTAVVAAYQVYFQVFGDVLQLLFVIPYILLLLSDHFLHQRWKAILIGLLMGIGFYAKAYTVVFFGLHYTLCLFWMYRKQQQSLKRYMQQWLIGGLTFVGCILPWSYLMYKKYHVLTLSGLAGKLNMSWYINSGKSFNSSIQLLIPPSYSDSPSFWEDPWFSQTNLSSPFSSLHHFFKWIARVGYNSLESIQCIQEISIVGVTILLLSIYGWLFKPQQDAIEHKTNALQLLVITCLILPIGYIMMHVETRYLWLMIPLLMVLGMRYLQQTTVSKRLQNMIMMVLACSFMLHPILQFKALRYKNKDLFEKAAWLKEKGIEGRFTSNINDAGQMWVIAYLNHAQFYTIERSEYSEEELIQEMKRYQVEYFLFEAQHNVIHQSNPSPQNFDMLETNYGITLFKLKHGI